MRRRALLACLTSGSTLLAGCSSTERQPDVFNPTGSATVRPLQTPFVQHGLTDEAGPYLVGKLFHAGDTLPVTDVSGAARFADTVGDLSGTQFAVLTNLRTAGAVPASLWPADYGWRDGQFHVELERRASSATVDADEAVGVALTVFDCDGEPPQGVTVVFPGGATMTLGRAD